MEASKTFLLDAEDIRNRIVLNSQFSVLLINWHDKGKPNSWYELRVEDFPFELYLQELKQLGVRYYPTKEGYVYYFSDLVRALVETSA